VAERGRSSRGRRSGSSKAGSSRSAASKRSSSSRSSPRRSTSSASSRSRTSASRKTAARKGGQARGRQQKARKQARTTARAATRPATRLDLSSKNVAELRERLRKNLIRPFDLVMLSRDRIEEAVNEAVDRGRITADDAQKLATQLVRRGRKQTDDVLSDLEQLLSQGPGGATLRRTRKQVETAGRQARSRAIRAADPALAQADRARRAAGVGPSFPITSYDDLTAAQVQSRLGDLKPAELRKVRDYERRHANRKSVLGAIEQKLS
jgi:polyhydroxyalkanoate synthesis regulator phasin